MIFNRDLDPEALQPVLAALTGPCSRVLVLSSPPAVGMLREFRHRFMAKTAPEQLVFRGVKNRFFGGNIHSAGLLTSRT